MVLLAVIVEYQLATRSYNALCNSIAISSIDIPISHTKSLIENHLSKITHVAVILGTVIWGYGDIFFKQIKCI